MENVAPIAAYQHCAEPRRVPAREWQLPGQLPGQQQPASDPATPPPAALLLAPPAHYHAISLPDVAWTAKVALIRVGRMHMVAKAMRRLLLGSCLLYAFALLQRAASGARHIGLSSLG